MQFSLQVAVVCGVLFCAVRAVPTLEVIDEAFASTVEARQTNPYTSINCGGRWGSVNAKTATDDINYYSSSSNYAPTSCRGPGQCGPVVSSDGTVCLPQVVGDPGNGPRLGQCNNNNYSKCVSKGTLADRWHMIVQHCSGGNSNGNGAGQAFYQDGTNAIVQACSY